MTTQNKPRPGQPDLERFIKDEVARRWRSPKKFLNETAIQQSTFYRVIQDSPSIGSASFRALEGALDLPRYILDYLAEGKPADMGSAYDRDLWDIYLLPLNDQQRAHYVERLADKYAAGEYREIS